MGYILPIQQHTYKNYQYRMYKKDKTPHQIQGVRMVKFIPIQSEIDFYKEDHHFQRNERIKKEKAKKRPKPKKVTTYQITPKKLQHEKEKGRHINVQI